MTIITVRDNTNDGKLAKSAICCRCQKPLAKVRKYRVCTVTLPTGIAFYYSHVGCGRI
jgi:hypothetical protein